jgi:hypothetical protein
MIIFQKRLLNQLSKITFNKQQRNIKNHCKYFNYHIWKYVYNHDPKLILSPDTF